MSFKAKKVISKKVPASTKKIQQQQTNNEAPISLSAFISFKSPDTNNNSTVELKSNNENLSNQVCKKAKIKKELANNEGKSTNNTAEDKKVSIDKMYLVGDIVWSKIPGHCWWPSMITYDPVDAVFFVKPKIGNTTKYHVQFFGDKLLRGWVFKSNIIKFEGKL